MFEPKIGIKSSFSTLKLNVFLMYIGDDLLRRSLFSIDEMLV